MAGFQLSPGVQVNEIDLTGIVPGVGTTDGAYAGDFQWGPIEKIITISDESDLVSKFYKPDANTFESFFTAANFLQYSNNLKVVRSANTSAARNATVDGSGLLITNEDKYLDDYYDGSGVTGEWAARYAGSLGNSLTISVCPSSNAYSSEMNVTANVIVGNTTVVFSANAQNDISRPLKVGDFIQIGSFAPVEVIGLSGNTATVNTSTFFTSNVSAQTAIGSWKYASEFESAPGTSSFVENTNGSNDEMHVIVIDRDGRFTGFSNTVVEKFGFVSKALNAKNNDGTTNFYRDVIFNRSRYIYWTDHPIAGTNWGSEATGTEFTVVNNAYYYSLNGGVYAAPTTAQRITSYDKFRNADEVDVSLVLAGNAESTLITYLIQSVAEYRKDCVVFCSPSKTAVVDNAGNEQDATIAFRNLLPSSSYAFMDSGWKYQYDKYNNVYRWVPLNGDIAGLAVRTDRERDPWFSFAGFNRGHIKNVTKLSWNPNQTNRDELYKKGINPVVTIPGEGTILYGDKTLQSKPSAFDRINVRRLFIVLEKAIARAAKYSLFEFNDQFTRAQFVNMVEPFLRDVKGRRGVYDFRVVCDETNNTPVVIDRNEFIGNIYIKPARSINFITLNFVAVATGVTFEEVTGAF